MGNGIPIAVESTFYNVDIAALAVEYFEIARNTIQDDCFDDLGEGKCDGNGS